MAFFYEIRSADNTVLKRDGGFGRVARPLNDFELTGAPVFGL